MFGGQEEDGTGGNVVRVERQWKEPTLVVQVRFYARANSSGQYPSTWTGTAQVDLNELNTTSISCWRLQGAVGLVRWLRTYCEIGGCLPSGVGPSTRVSRLLVRFRLRAGDLPRLQLGWLLKLSSSWGCTPLGFGRFGLGLECTAGPRVVTYQGKVRPCPRKIPLFSAGLAGFGNVCSFSTQPDMRGEARVPRLLMV